MITNVEINWTVVTNNNTANTNTLQMKFLNDKLCFFNKSILNEQMNIECWWFTDEQSQGQTQSSHAGRRNNKKDVTCCSEQPEQKHLPQLRCLATRPPGGTVSMLYKQRPFQQLSHEC